MTNTETTPSPGPFAVRDCALIAVATARRAWTLKELADGLADIGTPSIYYHFWGGLLRPTFVEREFNNDFATWVHQSLHDQTLAERLAVIDPMRYADMEAVRQEVLEIIHERMDELEERAWSRGVTRFEFMLSKIVVFDTKRTVSRAEELPQVLPQLSAGSIFYHFIDARRRVEGGGDDFSTWLCGTGAHPELCRRFANLDPYFSTLTQLRDELTQLIREYFQEAPHA